MTCDTTFLLHLQPLNCPDLERGSGVRAGCPAPALPIPVPLAVSVVVMFFCSWLTPEYAAHWRQGAVCFNASLCRSST